MKALTLPLIEYLFPAECYRQTEHIPGCHTNTSENRFSAYNIIQSVERGQEM